MINVNTVVVLQWKSSTIHNDSSKFTPAAPFLWDDELEEGEGFEDATGISSSRSLVLVDFLSPIVVFVDFLCLSMEESCA